MSCEYLVNVLSSLYYSEVTDRMPGRISFQSYSSINYLQTMYFRLTCQNSNVRSDTVLSREFTNINGMDFL